MIVLKNILTRNLFLILIAVTFAFNSFGFILTFIIQQERIREKSFEQIESSRHSERIITLSFSLSDYEKGTLIQRVNEKEIKYDGKMFDVLSIEQSGESVILRCVRDVKEERLEKDFANYMDKNNDLKALSGKQIQFNHQIQFVELTKNCGLASPLNKNIFSSSFRTDYSQTKPKVITPPPELILL